MKKRNFFKSKKQLIIYAILFVLFIVGFIYFSTLDYSDVVLSDNEIFHQDFPIVNEDNVFIYVNVSEARNLEKSNNVILLFGNKQNEWVGYYAMILNNVAKEYKIDKIYYYDITDDRKNNNGTYESIVEDLGNYVVTLDDGTKELYGPTLLIKKNGQILLYDDETAINKGRAKADNYYTSDEIEMKENYFRDVLDVYFERENNIYGE